MNLKMVAIGVFLFLSSPAKSVQINVQQLITKIQKEDFPSYTVKRSVELSATKAWRGLILMSNLNSIPEQYQMSAVFVQLALSALDRKENPHSLALKKVNRLIGPLNKHSLDSDMRGCTKVYFIDDKNFDNAFTTTCHIFMTRSLPEKLDDNELRAVIAHEMAHGALGHFSQSYQKLFGKLGTNLLRLPIEEAFWLVHGQFHGYMGSIHELYTEAYQTGRHKFYQSTHFHPQKWQDRLFQWFDATMLGVSSGIDAILNKSLEEYGTTQDKVELEADVAAVVLLRKMGFSGEHLISALMKLENVKSESEIQPLPSHHVHTPRQYPSLYHRIKTIRLTEKLLVTL